VSAELVWAAYHEAGHAVAITMAFRTAVWLPNSAPQLPVKFVEIVESTPRQWSGTCAGMNVYSMQWEDRIAPRYRDLMERQITIHLAGAVAEVLARGERSKHEVLAFATTDRKRAAAVGSDLFRLTGDRYDELACFERARTLLLQHWRAVRAVPPDRGRAHRSDHRPRDPRNGRVVLASLPLPGGAVSLSGSGPSACPSCVRVGRWSDLRAAVADAVKIAGKPPSHASDVPIAPTLSHPDSR